MCIVIPNHPWIAAHRVVELGLAEVASLEVHGTIESWVIIECGLGQEIALGWSDGIQSIIAVTLQRSTINGLTNPCDGLVNTCGNVVNTDQQVASIVMVWRAKVNYHFRVSAIEETFVYKGSTVCANEFIDSGLVHFLYEHLEGTCPSIRSRSRGVELHAVDVSIGHCNEFAGRIYHFSLQIGIGIKAVYRDVIVGSCTVIYCKFTAAASGDTKLKVGTFS